MSTELSSIAVETLAAAEDPVETANAPDSLVASSLCSSRTDTVEEETCHPSSTQGESQVTNPSSDKTCKEHDAKASPEDTIECPYPIDVLMPVSGYQLWNGNRRYRMLVEHHLPAFQASASNTQEQAKIALDIVHTIQREGGRFLQAIDTPVEDSNGKGILCTTVWKILPETDILVALGDILRDERGQARKRRRHQRKERRRERREARRALMEQQQQSKVEGEAPMVGGVAGCSALRSLFYVPTMDCEDYTSTSSSSTASDGNVIKGPPAKKKARQSPVKKANSNKKYDDTDTNEKQKSANVNFHYKPKPTKSKEAYMEQEGDSELPKGVTIRPSGKWQAQTYFAGQSRYVGVYENSRMAARAYVVVQEFLRKYRENRNFTRVSPKEELARIFAEARKAADEAVQELRQLQRSTTTDTHVQDENI